MTKTGATAKDDNESPLSSIFNLTAFLPLGWSSKTSHHSLPIFKTRAHIRKKHDIADICRRRQIFTPQSSVATGCSTTFLYSQYKSHVLTVQSPCTRSTKPMYCHLHVLQSEQKQFPAAAERISIRLQLCAQTRISVLCRKSEITDFHRYLTHANVCIHTCDVFENKYQRPRT